MPRSIVYKLNVHLTQDEKDILDLLAALLDKPYTECLRIALQRFTEQALTDIMAVASRPPAREEDGATDNPRLVITGVISRKSLEGM